MGKSGAERAVTKLFDEAFVSAGARPSWPHKPSASPRRDVIVRSPAGLQLEYSDSTALWLADVASDPAAFAPIYSFLAGNILAAPDHPIGGLLNSFAALMQRQFSGGLPFGGADRARAQVGVATRCIKLGCGRLLKLLLDFLPPLQMEPGSHFAHQAVEAVVFDSCNATLRALLGRAFRVEDSTCNARLDILQEEALLPCHLERLGVPKRLWLGCGDDGPGGEGSKSRMCAVM